MLIGPVRPDVSSGLPTLYKFPYDDIQINRFARQLTQLQETEL